MHGSYEIWSEDRVIGVRYHGAVNEETAQRLSAEFRALAAPLTGAPWAVLSEIADWDLATPEAMRIIHDFRLWSFAHDFRCQATVAQDDVKRAIHRRSLLRDAPAGFEAEYFATRAEARAWLQGLGYLAQ